MFLALLAIQIHFHPRHFSPLNCGLFFGRNFMSTIFGPNTMFYGLIGTAQLFAIVAAVCKVLGAGANGCAELLLLETAAQETRLGTFRDPSPAGAGRGAFQCDPIGFTDVQQRVRIADVNAVRTAFNFDLRTLHHDCLDVSPLAAAIFARLHYKLVIEPIPATLWGRAEYWKKYYNSSLGKGRPDEYVENAALVERYRSVV